MSQFISRLPHHDVESNIQHCLGKHLLRWKQTRRLVVESQVGVGVMCIIQIPFAFSIYVHELYFTNILHEETAEFGVLALV